MRLLRVKKEVRKKAEKLQVEKEFKRMIEELKSVERTTDKHRNGCYQWIDDVLIMDYVVSTNQLLIIDIN